MSELDLSQPLTPPEPTSSEVVLTPPAAVPEIDNEHAVGMVTVAPAKRTELQAKADSFVSDLAAQVPGSPEFSKRIDDITRMGEQDIRSSAEVPSRMLERPSSSLASARGRGPFCPQRATWTPMW